MTKTPKTWAEVLQEMLKQLEEMFGRYKDAEGALLKEFDRIQKK